MEHECGVLGIISPYFNIHNLLISGLASLQHRGYEGSGISYLDENDKLIIYKDLGLVKDIYTNVHIQSNIATGHVRYSTRQKSNKEKMLSETQPIKGETFNFSVVHNGNIPTINKIKEAYDIISNNDSDTCILTKFIEILQTKFNDWYTTFKYIIDNIAGSYCLLILVESEKKIYILRDRFGIRPLSLYLSNTLCYIASESICFNNIGLNIDPHQIIHVDRGSIISIDSNLNLQYMYKYQDLNLFCSFEYIYFMDYQSVIDDKRIEDIRYELGFQLGLSEQNILPNSVCIPIPNSSLPSGSGFSDSTGIPNFNHLVKKEETGRTFILPSQMERIKACDNKFIIIDSDKLKDKNIYLIDDSIVRGTTIKSVINKLREFNPKTIHVRIISPMIVSPCYFGIDMSKKEELISSGNDLQEICNILGANSLKYIDIDTMKKVFGHSTCTSCFTGEYNNKLLDW